MTAIYHWLWRLGPGNPMVVRIVQNASRRTRHLWVRMAYLGLMICLVTFGLLLAGPMGEASLTDLAKAGAHVFSVVAYGQVILVCLLAPLFMAGAIGQEQAGKTLDILLTTPLSNLQIVLGSLLGRLFFVLALIASGLPLFAILQVFGGVPVSSIFVAFAVAALVALAVGAVAVMLSVFRAGGRKAVYIFVIAVVGYLLVVYEIDVLIVRRMTGLPGGMGVGQTTFLTPLHPLLVLEASINSATYKPPAPETLGDYPAWLRFYLSEPFAAFATLTFIGSGILVFWSAIALRLVGQTGGQRGIAGWLMRRLRLSGSSDAKERRRPPRTVWANPIAWREANTRGQNVAATAGRWLFFVIGLLLAGGALALYHTGQFPNIPDPNAGGNMSQVDVFRDVLLILLLLELAIIVMVAIYLSAGAVSREREDGTLDLLLTTPITPRQLIWGKLRGLVSFLALMLAVPICTLAMVSLYTVIGQWMQWPQATPSIALPAGGSANVELMLPEAPLLLAMMLVPFVATCVIVGMNFSLSAKGVLGAVVWSVGVVGMTTLVTGFCGYSAAYNIPFLGPILNAFSPATNVTMLIDPWHRIESFVTSSGSEGLGRISLLIAAAAAAGGYSLIVYSVQTGMVRGFDQTVRKLTGTA